MGFILQQLQNIALRQGPLPIQIEGQSWVDWRLWGQTPFLHVTTIFCIIVSLSLFNGYDLSLNKNGTYIALIMDGDKY